jgi:hypothetical protein
LVQVLRVQTHRVAFQMLHNADNTIALLLPIIATRFISFKTINILARVNKTLWFATRDDQLYESVAKIAKGISKTAAKKLFVLPRYIKLSYMYSRPVYAVIRIEPKCKMIRVFELAMKVHGSVAVMSSALRIRQQRSFSMKLVWERKKAIQAAEKNERRREINEIKEQLLMIHSLNHITTDAELYYEKYGIIKQISRVYRNKRLMAQKNAGLLNIGGVSNSFLRVARDMTDPDKRSHTEKLFILRHCMAWEHYLLNYTNYRQTLLSVADIITDVDHVEFLYPLPTRWPWICQQAKPLDVVHDVSAANLLSIFNSWIAQHDALYEDP